MRLAMSGDGSGFYGGRRVLVTGGGGFLGSRLVRLALFGSKLEGRDTPDSDIDLFILVKDSAWPTRSQILDLAFEVNLKHSVYLSPRVIKESAYADPVWRETPFLRRLRENSLSVSV